MAGATAVVLAAGKGTRMKSDLPKVLFPVLGRPMIQWVVDALESADIQRIIVVVGYQAELVKQELSQRDHLSFAIQSEQKGTGHAVQMCRSELANTTGPVFVVAGDSPLVQPSSLKQLLQIFKAENLSCLLGTLEKDQPQGLGRIVRDKAGRFLRIVEEKDATPEERSIREVNMSTYLFDCQSLLWSLDRLGNTNAQQEFYLTDCPALLLANGQRVDARAVLQPCEALSINTVDELTRVESKMREMGYRCES